MWIGVEHRHGNQCCGFPLISEGSINQRIMTGVFNSEKDVYQTINSSIKRVLLLVCCVW